MNRRVFLKMCVFLGALSFISAKPTEPDWFKDYRSVYPDSKYIAQLGRAETEQTAKTDAVAQIARYFKTSVNASLKTSVQSVTDGENVSESTSVVNDVDVMSQVDLFAVEFTAPYYFKKEKKWHCVAYIDREKAWEQYKPTVENAKIEFFAIYKKALAEPDPLEKCAMYGKAWKSGKKFLEKLEYARILDSNKESAYSEDRKTVSEIPALVAAEMEKCTVYLLVSGDWGNIIATSLSQTLSKNGFKIEKNSKAANYIARATVECNASGNDPISIIPSLDLKIEGKSKKSSFAFQFKSENKAIAYTLENAQKKSYPIFAGEIEKALSAELAELFGNK